MLKFDSLTIKLTIIPFLGWGGGGRTILIIYFCNYCGSVKTPKHLRNIFRCSAVITVTSGCEVVSKSTESRGIIPFVALKLICSSYYVSRTKISCCKFSILGEYLLTRSCTGHIVLWKKKAPQDDLYNNNISQFAKYSNKTLFSVLI